MVLEEFEQFTVLQKLDLVIGRVRSGKLSSLLILPSSKCLKGSFNILYPFFIIQILKLNEEN